MKSAVKWLVNELIDNGVQHLDIAHEIIEKAEAMEKEQHNETWDSAHQAGRFEGKGIAEENWQTFETHWEETFNSK